MPAGSNPLNKSAIIIQARMSSRRFPGKMMSKLSGMPLVEYLYKRCKHLSLAHIIVATSIHSSDDELYDYCREKKIPVVRGSLNNVLERYILAADSVATKYIARVCGDTPFVDLSLVNTALETLDQENLDYVSFDKKTCLPGFYSEVFTLTVLKKAATLVNNKQDLEHVTKIIIENPNLFRTKFLNADLNLGFTSRVPLTIDYPEDLKRANLIIGKLSDKLEFASGDILNLLDASDRRQYYRINV